MEVQLIQVKAARLPRWVTARTVYVLLIFDTKNHTYDDHTNQRARLQPIP